MLRLFERLAQFLLTTWSVADSRGDHKVNITKLLMLLLTLLTATSVSAIEIFIGQRAPITGGSMLDNIPDGQYPDTLRYVDPATSVGFSMSAYFAGQVPGVVTPPAPDVPANAQVFSYETITGRPSGPLTLTSQGLNRNIQVEDLRPFYEPRLVYGLLDVARSGRGALSMLFDYGVDILGLDLIGANTGEPGNVYLRLFDTRGESFQFLDLFGNLVDYLTIEAFDGPLYLTSFDRPIRGITLTNDDYAGIGFSTVVFRTVPTPPVIALLLIGLVFLKNPGRQP